ncbi:MAG: response regulator [Bacteroidia bacterium]|nr:response regulator [Bacteroidia bacterium]
MRKKLKCVLLVEDNEFTNIYNQKLIVNLNIAENIYVTESAEDALDFIGRKGKYSSTQIKYADPDIIFLDINMPGLNGWEFIEEYKKLNVKSNHPAQIVMLTTSPNPDDEQKAKQINEVIAFKRKPLAQNIIVDILKEHFPAHL